MKAKIQEKLKAAFTLPSLSAEQKKELLRSSLILLAICASCALLLSGVYSLVEGFIEDNREAPILAAAARTLPADSHIRADFDTDEVNNVSAVYEARTGDELIGHCVHATAEDYDGEMTVVVAVDKEGAVVAVEVVSMPEGVGTKVRDTSFLSQFVSKTGKVECVGEITDEGQVVAVSGATASSDAVTECVNGALAAVSQIYAEKAKEAAVG